MTMKMHDAYSVLKQVPETMRQLTKHASGLEAENARLRQKVAQFELRDRAVKLATLMEEKGIIEKESIDKMASKLMAEPDKLAMREEAAQVAAQRNLGMELGEEPSNGRNQLETYLMS
jgi:uncharacterized protein (DUF3084 family)